MRGKFALSFCAAVLLLPCVLGSEIAEGEESYLFDLTRASWSIREVTGEHELDASATTPALPVKSFPLMPNALLNVPPSDRFVHTIVTAEFDLPSAPSVPSALYLKWIGENWQIRLNGRRLARQVHWDGERIVEQRCIRGLMVPFDGSLLRKGRNTLTIYLVGRAPIARGIDNDYFGFLFKEGYYVGDAAQISRMHWPRISPNSVKLSLGIALFFLFIYWRLRFPYILAFSIYTILLCVYGVTLLPEITEVVHETRFVMRAKWSSLVAAMAAFGLFLFWFLFPGRRWPWYLITLTAIAGLLAAAIASAPFYLNRIFTLGVQGLGVTFVLLYLWLNASGIRERVPGAKPLSLVIAAACCLALWDVLDSVFFNSGIRLSPATFLITAVLIALILASHLLRLRDDLESSQTRYRALAESSGDVLMLLSLDGTILSVNGGVRRHLGLDERKLPGKNFLDLVSGGGEREVDWLSLIRQRTEEAAAGKSLELVCPLRNSRDEPYEMSIKLAPSTTGSSGRPVISLHARRLEEDVLIRSCLFEEQTYRIANDIHVAELLSRRLSEPLKKYLDEDDVIGIQIGLHELLINAIEHGNLGITFAEKTRAQEEGTYEAVLAARQKDPLLSRRTVTVHYRLTPDKVEYTITDAGAGFDHERMQRRSIVSERALNLRHGRGISLTRSMFDILAYRGKGNEVKLTKSFPRRASLSADRSVQ